MGRKIVGVIGGSGLYELEDLKDIKKRRISTPFGEPSDEFIIGVLDDVEMIFLPRHGKGHRILPSELNFRANIYGMKLLEAEWIISVSAVGSMKEEIRPGDMVLPDQFFDRTKGRISTFFGDGIVSHLSFADPICPELQDVLYQASKKANAYVHKGGTYLCMEGPQFSTRAESQIYRSWGIDIIGMTNLPEAKLAREAEICYATLALATDYDCWHETEEDVSLEILMNTMGKNIEKSKDIIKEVVKLIPEKRDCRCKDALKNTIVTETAYIPEDIKKNLFPIIGKYIK